MIPKISVINLTTVKTMDIINSKSNLFSKASKSLYFLEIFMAKRSELSTEKEEQRRKLTPTVMTASFKN